MALLLAFFLKLVMKQSSGEKMSILLIRLDQTLGDSAMNSPLLRELRRAYPDAELSLVVHPRIFEMVRFCPYVDRIHTYDWGTSLSKSLIKRHWLSLKFCYQNLRFKKIDLAMVPRFDEDHHAGFIALFSGATRRIAYTERASARKKILNAGFDHLYTDILPAQGIEHEVERNLNMVRYLGFQPQSEEMEFWCGKDDDAYAKKIYLEHGIDLKETILVGLGLSGGYSALKRWPIEYYIELAGSILGKYKNRNVKFLLVGGKEDVNLGAKFQEALPLNTINMIAKTSILQMGALLKSVNYFIGNDSGAMHVAVANSVNVIGIFGSSCHHRFGAWGVRSHSVSLELDCGPCRTGHVIDRCGKCIYESPKCMDDLMPNQISQKIDIEILENIRPFTSQSQ
ncbi:glycosyltransferase family 9 protein [Collimonas sp. NPDC087041]|uniref:glycosyltransferase family 9 protein n=1 Tax=Collimonas sp. NPDC087041 TaxID=3363960 RepID=UPI003813FA7A